MRWSERLDFLRQFRRATVATGALQPSSRYLAHAMTTPMRGHSAPRHIIELGPGTGAVTRAIAAAMTPADRLDCYEISPHFAEYLTRQVAEQRVYRTVADRIRIHCAPGQAAVSDDPVDFVICSVPLNNLPQPTAAAIFDRGFDLLADHGWFTYFEYPLLPRLRRMFVGRPERQRIDSIRNEKRQRRRDDARSQIVMRNVPPARAVHLPKQPTLGVDEPITG